jgi:hypothetical protein
MVFGMDVGAPDEAEEESSGTRVVKTGQRVFITSKGSYGGLISF